MITKDEVKYLRNCDDIVFWFHEGKSIMTPSTREQTNRQGWVKPETRLDIQVSARFTDYGKEKPSYNAVPRSCSAYLGNYENSEVNTIINFIQAGDEIILDWVSSNNSQYMDRADLHCDELKVIVKRGNKQFCFLAHVSACPNNTARMIKW